MSSELLNKFGSCNRVKCLPNCTQSGGKPLSTTSTVFSKMFTKIKNLYINSIILTLIASFFIICYSEISASVFKDKKSCDQKKVSTRQGNEERLPHNITHKINSFKLYAYSESRANHSKRLLSWSAKTKSNQMGKCQCCSLILNYYLYIAIKIMCYSTSN